MKSKLVMCYRGLLRLRRNRRNRRRLKRRDMSIIASNCTGGIISHDLGLPFLSPAVNLFFQPQDYLKFVSDLPRYCACELTEDTGASAGYPVGRLEDICVHFLHDKSFAEAKAVWERRVGRIRFDRLFFLLVQRDGCTEEMIRQFDALPFPHKAAITSKPMPDVESAVFLEGSVCNGEVRDLCQYQSRWSGKRWIDDFDYVSFLNGERPQKEQKHRGKLPHEEETGNQRIDERLQ